MVGGVLVLSYFVSFFLSHVWWVGGGMVHLGGRAKEWLPVAYVSLFFLFGISVGLILLYFSSYFLFGICVAHFILFVLAFFLFGISVGLILSYFSFFSLVRFCEVYFVFLFFPLRHFCVAYFVLFFLIFSSSEILWGLFCLMFP